MAAVLDGLPVRPDVGVGGCEDQQGDHPEAASSVSTGAAFGGPAEADYDSPRPAVPGRPRDPSSAGRRVVVVIIVGQRRKGR